MEFLYNPDSMPEAEIKATFVAREWLVAELISQIKRQPDGAGVQHILVIAQRGMGKTTVLLMVKFGINDSNLSKRWQAVKFPEESYGVYDLADFWLEVLNIIVADTNDEELRNQVEALRTEFSNNDDLQEAALAVIKDWRRKHKKRLVLLVDNVDMIFEQINDERDNARLREVLMNDGTMMMIGCAVSFFDEARSYNKTLYNFFKTYDLTNLKFEQIQELLLRRARLDQIENFKEKLKANETGLRVLQYFTGGNPRLVLMLYRIVTQSDFLEVQRGLEKLLDEVTPYFKAKVESLPAQLRKILDHIARVSSKTNEGLTPTEISQAIRLTPNQVSAQLKRLSEMGYVRAANLRGRNSYYTLSEPLYAVWHQMRFGRDARERTQWLVSFLKAWYDTKGISEERQRLASRFWEYLSAGHFRDAHNVFEHQRYLLENLDAPPVILNAVDNIIHSYLELKDVDILKNSRLSNSALKNLSAETLNKFLEAGLISKNEIGQFENSKPVSGRARLQAEARAHLMLGIRAIEAGRMIEALRQFDHAVGINSKCYEAWYNRGIALYNLSRHEEAVTSFDHALKIKPGRYKLWFSRGVVLEALEKYEDAIKSYDRALQINPNAPEVWFGRGSALYNLGRNQEAVESINQAEAIKPSHKIPPSAVAPIPAADARSED